MTTIDSSTATETAESQHGYIRDKKRYLDRLKRIEGQARGIHRMVEEEQYCIDILTQISALTSALQGVALGLLDDHLNTASPTPPGWAGPTATRRSAKPPRPLPAWSAPDHCQIRR